MKNSAEILKEIEKEVERRHFKSNIEVVDKIIKILNEAKKCDYCNCEIDFGDKYCRWCGLNLERK